MTIDEIDKRYNRCPFCEWYVSQPAHICDDCKWKFPIKRDYWSDNFKPTERWDHLLERLLDGGNDHDN